MKKKTKNKERINKMNKIYNNLSIENLTKTEWFNQFDYRQKEEIRLGLESNLDISIYAKPEFDWTFQQFKKMQKNVEKRS